MPGRNSLTEVEHAITQLAALHTSLKNLSNDSIMLQSYEALVVLSTSCSKISDRKLLEQSGKAILQTLKACQGARTTISLKVPSNRFYTAGFRALSTILATLRSQHGLSTAELVELLRHFFTHGLELSLASTVTPAAVTFGQGSLRDGAAAGSARYRPPHARRRSSSSNAGWSDSSSAGSQSGSESDTGSDTDSSSRGGSRDTASAVRLAALSCLQQLAKADGKALHPFWIMLLPVYNPLQTKYHDATLMDAVVRDPVPKVRVLAAAVLSSMLEGPAQKAYMAIAEATSSARPPVRGFTTLSSTLGHLVIALHDGLLHAISNESHMAALSNMLKTLGTLMLSAAYSRLPTDLLSRCIEVLSRRLLTAPQKMVAASADIQAVQTAACACLAAAFGTKAAFPTVTSLFCAQPPHPLGVAAAPPAGQNALITTLLKLSCSESATTRYEALSALHGLAKNYTAALALHWDAISHAVELNVKAQRLSGSGSAPASPRLFTAAGEGTPTAEAKSAQQAVKLLSEFLSGCHRLDEAKAADESSSQPSDLSFPSPVPTMTPAAIGKGVPPTGASCAVVDGMSPNGVLSARWKGSSAGAGGASAAMGKGSSPIGASAAMGTSHLVEQSSGLLSGASSMQRADLANAHSPVTTSPMESDISRLNRINSNVQRQPDGTGPERSDGHSEQMAQVSHASKSQEALQTEKAEQGVPDASCLNIDPLLKMGDHATGAQCVDMWRRACSCLIPQAVCHNSPLVRSAVQAGFSEMPHPVFWALEPSWQAQICSWIWHACQHDSAAAVRAAAAKCTGQVAEGMPVQGCISGLMKSVDVLCSSAQESTLSVRVSAVSALANLADAWQQQQQLDAVLLPSLTRVAAAAMTACRDSDKVQVNAVRALGSLFALQCPPLGQQQQPAQLVATPPPCPSSQQPAACAATASMQSGSTPAGAACSCGQVQCSCGDASCSSSNSTCWWGEEWIGEGLQCLLLSLDSSTDKVQWSACYAAGRLFQNCRVAHSAEQNRQLDLLLSALLNIIRVNSSYKIRNHAAVALGNLGQRCLYGELWHTAVQTVSDALLSLQKSEDGDDRSINAGKNYQFKDALRQQLQICMARLMEIATPADMKSRA